jgi:hypothetical protein
VTLRLVAMGIAAACLFLQASSSGQQAPGPKQQPRLVVAECAADGLTAVVPWTTTKTPIAEIEDDTGNLEIQSAYKHADEDDGVIFSFVRGGKTIHSFLAEDQASYDIWLAFDRKDDRLAMTYGSGESIGLFEVAVFQIHADEVTDVSASVEPAFTDFKSRHYCKARGDNVTALKWIGGDLLLMMEVYPTSDCGPDLGHVEGYRVSIPNGKIVEHLTLAELRHYPGVCLENYAQ